MTDGTDATTPQGSAAGTPPQGQSPDLQDPEIIKAIASEVERRVGQAQKKWDLETREREAAAAEKAKKDAVEQKLIENKDLEKLAELRAKEADEARAELDTFKRKALVDTLLDQKDILRPKQRALFHAATGDLERVARLIDEFKEENQESIIEGITKGLGNEGPPKSKAPPEGSKGLVDQIADAEAEAYKTGDFTKSMALKDKLLNDRLNAGNPQVIRPSIVEQAGA